MSIHLILYSKPGCHLCEGLQEKLAQIRSLDFSLDVRDITTRDDWFQAYQYEIPVLVLVRGEGSGVRSQESEELDGLEGRKDIAQGAIAPSFIPLPRLSPRATVQQLEQMLRKYL